MIHKIILFSFLLINLLWSCLPPAQENLNDLSYSKSDSEFQRIKNLQDRRSSDSLLSYLSNPKAIYRLLAAEAFGSYRDSSVIDTLSKLLKDENESVKQAAIYSLGQIGNKSAEKFLIQAFIAVDSSGPFQLSNSMILEALGKCGTDSTLALISKIQNYKSTQSILLEGQALCLYRFGLRNKISPLSNSLLIDIACNKNYTDRARLIAAHCLQRFKTLDVKSYYKELRSACFEEKNPNIRMCIISAFARIGRAESLQDLEELYSRILDIRVQCNLVKGLENYPNGQASVLAFKALQNPSSQVAQLAAGYFVKNAKASDEDELQKILLINNLPWEAKSQIYAALINLIPTFKPIQRDILFSQIFSDIKHSNSPYEKSSYILTLKNTPIYLNYLIQLSNKEKDPITLTSISTCIAEIYKNSLFTTYYKGKYNPIYKITANYLSQICSKHDVGPLAVIAEWLKNEKGTLIKYFNIDSSLIAAQKSLKLPRDIETYNEIENTISIRNNKKFEARKVEYNHPIHWARLTNLPDTLYADILTNKGKLEIELYPKIAPATVINFLELVDQNYFNDKIIHRLVPNFVIQSGCPRGDGYGSLDYTIRTESYSGLNYQSEGIVGMASAGLDTECSQFFISFSSCPHLDGKYTIFGKMIKGIDIMCLSNQGDKISKISLR